MTPANTPATTSRSGVASALRGKVADALDGWAARQSARVTADTLAHQDERGLVP